MNEELEKLCVIIKSSKEVGVPIQATVTNRVLELLIEEIDPIFDKEIGPLLKNVGIPLDLKFLSHPGYPPKLTISLTPEYTYRRKVEEPRDIDITKKFMEERTATHSIMPKRQRDFVMPTNMRSTFCVTFPDGIIIRERSDVETFIASLRKIGFQRIYESNCQTFKGYKLVDVRGREDSSESQRYVDGYYVYVRMPSTQYRIDVLYRISDLLSVGLVVRNNSGEKVYGTEAQRRRRTGLRVTFNDGTVIEEVTANATFVEAVKKIGLQRVSDTGVRLHGIRVVSTEVDPRYPDRCIPAGDGYYVASFSDNMEKWRALERIADRLQLDIKVEIL